MVHIDIAPLNQFVTQSLGGHSRIHEDEGGILRVNRLFDGFHLLREGFAGILHVDREQGGDGYVDKLIRSLSAEIFGNGVGIAYRCRECNPLEFAGILPQALESDRKLCAALVAGKLVNLVHDDVTHVFHVLPQFFAGEHRLKSLGCRYKQVGRLQCLFSSLRLCRVAVADADGKPEFMAPPLEAQEYVAV